MYESDEELEEAYDQYPAEEEIPLPPELEAALPPPAPPEPPAPAESPDINWNPEGGGEGELVVTVPAIPERGVAETRLAARGTKKSAAKKVAKMATKILQSKAAQAVMPPQAKLALSAARGLSKIVPSQWKKAGIRAGARLGKKALKKLKFW